MKSTGPDQEKDIWKYLQPRPRGEREETHMPREVQRDWFQERERSRDRSRDREWPVHQLSKPEIDARQGTTPGRAFERGPERSHPRELDFERTDF